MNNQGYIVYVVQSTTRLASTLSHSSLSLSSPGIFISLRNASSPKEMRWDAYHEKPSEK